MKVKEIQAILESFAPPSYQESYDNSKLIVGSPDQVVSGVLVSLDCTEEIVDEAIDKGCNMVVAHHPILFSGLKQLTGKNYIERTILKAIKNDVAIYASHTNLDNTYNGVNFKIAEMMKLDNCRVLDPKSGLLSKLVVFCPVNHASAVREAMFSAGGGHIGNYAECSFNSQGEGTFNAQDGSEPYVGKKRTQHHEKELRIEMVVPNHLLGLVVSQMKKHHPYEEVAYDVYQLQNKHERVGSGVVGELAEEMEALDFLNLLKKVFKAEGIRYTKLINKKIKRVALCGGSGSFLLSNAIAAQADVFVTSDFKYHQFFDTEDKIVIADIGHYESEQYTKELIYDVLTKKITNFAVHLSYINTNPINYL